MIDVGKKNADAQAFCAGSMKAKESINDTYEFTWPVESFGRLLVLGVEILRVGFGHKTGFGQVSARNLFVPQ